MGTITTDGGHVAIIEMLGLGLLVFHEQGGNLAKLALIPQPKDAGIDCAAILREGFDAVVLGLAGGVVTPSRGRAAAARARSKATCGVPRRELRFAPSVRAFYLFLLLAFRF